MPAGIRRVSSRASAPVLGRPPPCSPRRDPRPPPTGDGGSLGERMRRKSPAPRTRPEPARRSPLPDRPSNRRWCRLSGSFRSCFRPGSAVRKMARDTEGSPRPGSSGPPPLSVSMASMTSSALPKSLWRCARHRNPVRTFGPLRALKIRPQYFVNRKGRPGPWLETEEMHERGLSSKWKLRPRGVPCISHAKMLCLFSCPILFL